MILHYLLYYHHLLPSISISLALCVSFLLMCMSVILCGHYEYICIRS